MANRNWTPMLTLFLLVRTVLSWDTLGVNVNSLPTQIHMKVLKRCLLLQVQLGICCQSQVIDSS